MPKAFAILNSPLILKPASAQGRVATGPTCPADHIVSRHSQNQSLRRQLESLWEVP